MSERDQLQKSIDNLKKALRAAKEAGKEVAKEKEKGSA